MKQMLKYILSVVMENLKYAEAKHSVSVALNSGIILFVSSSIRSSFFTSTAFGVLAIIFCGVSIAYGFFALMSRDIKIKRKTQVVSTRDFNLVYFEDIATFGVNNYLEKIIKNYDFPSGYIPDGFEEDLARQIILNAKVTRLKFKYFNISIRWLILGIIFGGLTVVFVGVGVWTG